MSALTLDTLALAWEATGTLLTRSQFDVFATLAMGAGPDGTLDEFAVAVASDWAPRSFDRLVSLDLIQLQPDGSARLQLPPGWPSTTEGDGQ